MVPQAVRALMARLLWLGPLRYLSRRLNILRSSQPKATVDAKRIISAATNAQKDAGMPGFLEPIWETIFRVATWSALIFGALSIGSAFVSAWVGWEITDATQKDADVRIRAGDVRIAEATARAAEANQKAEEERLARVKLETRIAPRKITQEQQNELTERLKGYKVRETTLIASPSTAENEWVVRWLGAPLAAAGWNIKLFPGTATATVLFPAGIVIYARLAPDGLYFPDKEQTGDMAAADRLAKSLSEFGIEATAIPAVDIPPECIRIVVNSR
jgi:hypothetical protein